ncbi:MAG: arsenosugar biosynthesis radical SAM (seleno)protein ArsS [Planctomycetota bacterium]
MLERGTQARSDSMDQFGLPIIGSQAFGTRAAGGQLRAADRITTLQINIGLHCNLACKHCHVESSPKRRGERENMSRETAQRIVSWLGDHPSVETIDVTGGSPELNPHFRYLVAEARLLGRRVIDRCNPTIIGFKNSDGCSNDWIPRFLADHEVMVVASLPCYLEDNVRKQRGLGAYNESIEGLLALNSVGYGVDPKLRLNLVYNPTGQSLPPPADKLAADYHRELSDRFGLVFNDLWTITNMPIKRWRDALQRNGKLNDYMTLLSNAFNQNTVDHLMCRTQIHVDSQGQVHDCDFNYALDLSPVDVKGRLWEIPIHQLESRRISTAEHCLGCTAGCGSSCGGSLI